MEKLVSVCINTYNREDYVLETVQSVLNQTYRNLQIIIVDDCSTDNTVEILKGIKDDRIEIHCLDENGGVSVSNNETLRYVKGDFIAHLDSDDLWERDKIEKQVKFLEENQEYGACFSFSAFIDDKGNITNEGKNLGDTIFNCDNLYQAGFVRLFYEASNHLCHSSVMMRTEIFKKLGLHNLSYWLLHDFDWWARLILICPIYVIPEPLVLYRDLPDSNSTMNEAKTIQHNEEYARLIYNMIENCPRDIFLEAFEDRLKITGEHTDEEIELEKAFVLMGAFRPLKPNAALAMKKFDQLFTQEKYIRLSKEKFNFTLKDLHTLHQQEIYYNPVETACLKDTVQHLENISAQKDETISNLNSQYSSLCDIHNELSHHHNELSHHHNELIHHHKELSHHHSLLNNAHNELIVEHKTLSGEYDKLHSNYHELNRQFDDFKRMLPVRMIKPVIRLYRFLKNKFHK